MIINSEQVKWLSNSELVKWLSNSELWILNFLGSLLVCFQISHCMSTDSYSGLSMLTALVGILFLANMAQTGRSSYEEILIKAKNNELSTPDDPSVKSAGEYSFIYKCHKWVSECCFPKFSHLSCIWVISVMLWTLWIISFT